ncbi:PLD nuclease N-terminal domain-containing protein [Streptomyces sp. N2-109]|uniref:PLD nuclease N-terminal domain-containing protein n=1 Tax=Streptomyces gossypii TaxID=2883101 RepID=A0ABT2JXB6_9ACTN|nr:PLD nuclease N-terminal domain-containing protein [Streptomyces gossypii]MCT2592099.1 PLD nuclease N-terminal domain-containing protein [Streptomyces gossypii]
MLRYLPFLLVLAVWIYAFIDCLNTPEKEVRKLPKVAWVIIVLLFGQVLLGPIAWFAVGRPRRNAPYGATKPQERRWVAPDDNPDFLKSINDPTAGNGNGPAAGDTPRTGDGPSTPGEKDRDPRHRKEERDRDGRGDIGPEEDSPPPAGS